MHCAWVLRRKAKPHGGEVQNLRKRRAALTAVEANSNEASRNGTSLFDLRNLNSLGNLYKWSRSSLHSDEHITWKWKMACWMTINYPLQADGFPLPC